ncbi:MAG: rhodanese-like domain-containing protein [Desulfosarcinaceae bacterium]|nr:rhodanese-like domain-containing protein [Desulfosarcinaceae bacterium]
MPAENISEISAEELRSYMAERPESDYLLIDVRQPEEYVEGHIPGARLLPIMELVPRLYELPSDRDIIFYCQSGGRSAAAAVLTLEEEVCNASIYNIRGGMVAWNGYRIEGAPRWHLFDAVEGTGERLHLAMNLEKGAQRFYEHVTKAFPAAPFSATFARLATAEVAHARTIHGFWQRETGEDTAFGTIYADLTGEILEGGAELAEVLDALDRLAADACLPFIEMALRIEYAAYDLYRTIADNGPDAAIREAFLQLAQAEKAHMTALTKTIELCGGH